MAKRSPMIDPQSIRNVIRTLTVETATHRAGCKCIACKRLAAWKAEAARIGLTIA